MPKKILIISVSAGSGHVRAAEALQKTAAASYPELAVEHIDMMNYVSLPMKRIVIDTFELMCKRLPELWGYIYSKTNDSEVSKKFNSATKALKRLNSHALYEYINEYKPDYIICTHFFAADIIRQGQKFLNIETPVAIVITDYNTHSLWFVPGTDHYFVGTPKMAWKLEQWGFAPNQISVTGIPIDPVFQHTKNNDALFAKNNLDKNQRLILILSGGGGLIQINKIIKHIFLSSEPCQIVAIAGKNKSLLKKIRAVPVPKGYDLRPIGWTNAMDEYMRMADVIITKPGGLTTSECIWLEKPIIAIDPIPGQEEENAKYILNQQYGAVASTAEDLCYYLSLPADKLAPGYKKIPLAVTPAASQILECISHRFPPPRE